MKMFLNIIVRYKKIHSEHGEFSFWFAIFCYTFRLIAVVFHRKLERETNNRNLKGTKKCWLEIFCDYFVQIFR